jgi:hypothetical protein
VLPTTSSLQHTRHPLIDQPNDLTAPSPLPSAPPSTSPQAPDFKQVRRYLRTVQQREALGQFIKAEWSPAELAEYARSMYLVPGQTKPTAASYQFVIEKGPDHEWAQEALATMRAPGYVLPPFDRPEPKRYAWDDPDSPEHTPELRADVVLIAQLMRARDASRRNLPLPDPNEPIPRFLWRRCYRIRNRYHSLDDTLQILELREYSQPYTDDDTCGNISDNQQSQSVSEGLHAEVPEAVLAALDEDNTKSAFVPR